MLRRRCGIVHIAEARCAIGARVMAGRPAQRVSRARAAEKIVRRRDRRIDGARDRGEAARPHRNRQVAEVPADLRDEPARRAGRPRILLWTPAPVGKGVRPDFGSALGQLRPAIPRGFEEGEIGACMNRARGGQPVRRRPLNRNVAPLQRRQQLLRARRQIFRRDHLAEAHILLRIVQRLIGMIECAHEGLGLSVFRFFQARLSALARRHEAGFSCSIVTRPRFSACSQAGR